MTLLESIGKSPFAPLDTGFVTRESEDDIARDLFRPLLHSDREIVLIAGFDSFGRLVGIEQATGDSPDRCVIPPRCWSALLGQQPATLVMAHNHPSGIAQPSAADITCTREAVHFLRLLDIDLTDHLIFVESGHFSFRHAQLI